MWRAATLLRAGNPPEHCFLISINMVRETGAILFIAWKVGNGPCSCLVELMRPSRSRRKDTPMTMPLFAYFTRVGLVLLALLLALNFMLEPRKPEPDPAGAAIETFRRAQSTTGSAHPDSANSEFEPRRSETANYRAPEERQQPSTDYGEPAPVTKVPPESKSAKTKVRTRRSEPLAYSSYARDTSYFSAAEDRHAPR
jgi:hypothetical protein